MPKTVVKLCNIPQYKLTIRMRSLVWYRHPVNPSSLVSIDLFGAHVQLGFGNQPSSIPEAVQYHIESLQSLQEFYRRPLLIKVYHGNEVAGHCQLEPTTLCKKSTIAPILGEQNSSLKLGDIQMQFGLSQSAVDADQLRNLDSKLSAMIENNPEEFQKLYCGLKKQGYSI